MLDKVPGIVTEVSLWQFLNALLPIAVTLSGTI